MPTKNDFITKELFTGCLLLACAVLALIVSNSPLSDWYQGFLNIHFSILIDNAGISKPIVLWINDGLMAIFFLLVALELKRELVSGELSDYNNAILPVAGALGGMLVPVFFYFYMTQDMPSVQHAWAIPMATDIAFALGVLALFGKRVPLALKIFLMTLAIIDDLGAILVIAIFHTAKLSWGAFILAGCCLLVLIVLNRIKISNLSPFLLIGALMWFCVLKSGFHATMAGVILGFTIPIQNRDGKPMLENLEHDIHPMVVYCILPLFAFANAGVPLGEVTLNDMNHPLIMGIMAGLILGKMIGIFSFTWLAQKILKVKASFNNRQLFGVSALCGIGFTMSFFIAGLSFGGDELYLNYSRIGILAGSLIAMVLGIIILAQSLPKAEESQI